MKITNKLNSIIKIQLFVFLFLSANLSFANNKIDPTSNTKHSATDANDFNEKTKQEKREDSSKKSSDTNPVNTSTLQEAVVQVKMHLHYQQGKIKLYNPKQSFLDL